MDMSEILKKAQEMQSKMQAAQQELSKIRTEGTAGGGVVKVVVSGNQEIINVEIDSEIYGVEEKEMLEELIAAATNQALSSAKAEAAKHMQDSAGGFLGGALGGLNIPGL